MKLKYAFTIQPVSQSFMAMAQDEDPEVQSKVLQLNETGKDMLELLQQEMTEDELVRKLQEKYEGSEADIRSGVQKFIGKLTAEKLLV